MEVLPCPGSGGDIASASAVKRKTNIELNLAIFVLIINFRCFSNEDGQILLEAAVVMKKITRYICAFVFSFLILGCGNIADDETEHRNLYFCEELYEADQITLTTRAQYYDLETKTEADIHVQGYKVKAYEKGSLYRFIIELVGDLEQERLNLYFYVTADKIYRVCSDVFQGDDALFTDILDTDEKLVENSEIVCQSEDVSVAPKEGESGLQYEIHRSGNQITYSRSDVQPNGERGFYEWFVWEDGAGLVEYGSGFKVEADILYLYDIAVEARQPESGDGGTGHRGGHQPDAGDDQSERLHPD